MTGILGLDITLFLACFVGILVTSYWAIEAIKTVSEKFKISETFIGAVFLSVGTSFPEFINAIAAGIKDGDSSLNLKNSRDSFYNITGANIWQILFLSLVIAALAIYWKSRKKDDLKAITQIFWKDSRLSWQLTFMETCLLVLVFSFPHIFSYLTVGGFNFLSLFFLLVWIAYICRTYKSECDPSKQERAKYFLNCNKVVLAFITLSLWALFGAFSIINFNISSQFADRIGESASFGVILSFVTSSPEFSVMYFLFRQKEYQIAVSGFFGSSLFNLSLPFYSNIISLQNLFGNENSQIPRNSLVLWLILNVVVISVFPLTFWKKEKCRNIMATSSGIIILTLYVAVSFVISKFMS